MRELIDGIIYDTDGDGVVKVFEKTDATEHLVLYRGKNYRWFVASTPHTFQRTKLQPAGTRYVVQLLWRERQEELIHKYFQHLEA